ncbi:MAG: hypothetical protein IKA82_00610 [Clostridia bacterium]|nr:hypothetical protein [Clostridia bacterium]
MIIDITVECTAFYRFYSFGDHQFTYSVTVAKKQVMDDGFVFLSFDVRY